MSDASKQQDWTKRAVMAVPKGGYFPDKVEKGRYGPFFLKRPACYGFSIIAKLIPGREPVFYEFARNIEKAVADQPIASPRLSCTTCAGCSSRSMAKPTFMYQGIFDTDFDKYTEDAVALFGATGINTVFENLEGFPKDWRPTRRRSSSLCGNTIARVFWNTANTLT